MFEIEHESLWPLAGALLVYLVRSMRQRLATERALVGEINLLLRQGRDYFAYLSRPSHEWLKVGVQLSSSPYFSRKEYRVYSAMLSDLHLLEKTEALRVIAFYSHYDSCESLIEILFGGIRQQEQSEKVVTELQVEEARRRTERILRGLEAALTGSGEKIRTLRDLPADLVSIRATVRNPRPP